jgi:Uma2 family endonuclease
MSITTATRSTAPPRKEPTLDWPVAPADLVRLSVKQYHRMIDAEILLEGDPIELLEGLLVTKMPKKPSHRVVNRAILRNLEACVPEDTHYVDAQEPITADSSEPEPDISVVRGQPQEFLHRHPKAAELAMVSEISDTTLDRDRGIKKRIYARENIPIYWIVNLVDMAIEVYTNPTGKSKNPTYRSRKDYGVKDKVSVIIDGKQVGSVVLERLLRGE